MNKVANVSIVAANVQQLKEPRKRSNLVSKLKAQTKNFDIVLLSETGRPDETEAQAWISEFEEAGLSAHFTSHNYTAIVWKESANVEAIRHEPRDTLSAEFTDNSHRMTDIMFRIGSTFVRVVSIYAPAKDVFKRPFFTELRQLLDRSHRSDQSMIMGGDWNCVENQSIDSEEIHRNCNAGGQEMREIAVTHALTDVYRSHHPRKRLYTNDPGGGRSRRRLDRIYVTADLKPLLKQASVWSKLVKSTHVPMAARFYMPGAVEVGGGKFKLGSHVIATTETELYVTDLVAELHAKAVMQHPGDPLRAWNRTKELLLPHLQDLSLAMNRFRRLLKPEEYDLQGRYGSAMKSRVDPMLAGSSSIHIRLRKVRATDLTPTLRVNDKVLSRPDDVLGAARDFYAKLYDEEPIDEEALRDICKHFKSRLSRQAYAELEKIYSVEEIEKALDKCKIRSSPGPDGLPFDFYSKTWLVTGPILTSIANHVAETDPAQLPQKVAHIHLIHKQGDHDQMSNKRPISLINTDERILSKAFNRRLAYKLKDIVAPTQTGFIPGRWIGTNIANMQAIFDTSPTRARPLDGLVAVMDFEKAYDRIAHRYLERILLHVGFGRRAIRSYMSTYSNQTAQIFLNGWLSTPFNVRSGVRQGDPLAPSLFAIAIEGFACAIRHRVKGMEPCLKRSMTEPTIKEMLFADDAACALEDYADASRLMQAVSVYERASASRLNVGKSHITPVGRFIDLPNTTWRGWKVSREQFRYLGIQVGTNVDYAAWWKSVQAEVLRRMRGIPMFDLPLAAKCMILNTYCYSKILYYDKFAPAPDSVLSAIEDASKKALWGRQKAKVSKERLQTPLDNGGFGLFNLKMQLDVQRAQWVSQLLPADSLDERHLANIRLRLYAPLINERFTRQLNRTKRAEWKWHGMLCHPPLGSFLAARSAVATCLPHRWNLYLEAWGRVTTPYADLEEDNEAAWADHFLSRSPTVKSSIPLKWFRGPDGKKLEPWSFKFATKTYHAAKMPLIIPSRLEERYQFGEKRWQKWWLFLRRIRQQQTDAEDTQHLLSLNSLHAGAHVGSPRSEFVNNRSKTCVLCLSDDLETVQHLFVGCPFAIRLWSALYTSPHPQFPDLVCPETAKSLEGAIKRQVVFLHTIWSLSRSRRFSPSTLIAISDRDFDRLVREARARLAGTSTI